jgi:hypothetical protein
MCRGLAAFLLLLAPLAAAAETIELVNGDKLSGTVLERTEVGIVLEHALLGRVEIANELIEPPRAPNGGLFGTSLLAGWTRIFRIGVRGAHGNTRTNDVLGAFDLDYEDEDRRWNFDAAYRFSAADGVTTKHNAFAQLHRDWLLNGSPWFLFSNGRFDYDEFQSWKYRANAAAGVGYQFLDGERIELKGLLGPSLTRQFNENDFYVEALVGVEGTWKIAKDHRLVVANSIYPALNDLGEFRNLSSVVWSWKLLERPGLSLIAGVDNEYQSQVESGILHNDVKYSTSLGFDF